MIKIFYKIYFIHNTTMSIKVFYEISSNTYPLPIYMQEYSYFKSCLSFYSLTKNIKNLNINETVDEKNMSLDEDDDMNIEKNLNNENDIILTLNDFEDIFQLLLNDDNINYKTSIENLKYIYKGLMFFGAEKKLSVFLTDIKINIKQNVKNDIAKYISCDNIISSSNNLFNEDYYIKNIRYINIPTFLTSDIRLSNKFYSDCFELFKAHSIHIMLNTVFDDDFFTSNPQYIGEKILYNTSVSSEFILNNLSFDVIEKELNRNPTIYHGKNISLEFISIMYNKLGLNINMFNNPNLNEEFLYMLIRENKINFNFHSHNTSFIGCNKNISSKFLIDNKLSNIKIDSHTFYRLYEMDKEKFNWNYIMLTDLTNEQWDYLYVNHTDKFNDDMYVWTICNNNSCPEYILNDCVNKKPHMFVNTLKNKSLSQDYFSYHKQKIINFIKNDIIDKYTLHSLLKNPQIKFLFEDNSDLLNSNMKKIYALNPALNPVKAKVLCVNSKEYIDNDFSVYIDEKTNKIFDEFIENSI